MIASWDWEHPKLYLRLPTEIGTGPGTPPLKLTVRPLKMDGWETIGFPLGMAHFQVRILVAC